MATFSRRKLLLRYAKGALTNGDNNDGTTGIGRMETTSARQYVPSLQVPDTTVNYENVNGKPRVSKGPDGKITGFEYTDTATFSKDGSLDTGVLPFDGSDFTLHLKAIFKASDNPLNVGNSTDFPTILSAMGVSGKDFKGFNIRYERDFGLKLKYVNDTTKTTIPVNSDGLIDIYIAYQSNHVKVTNKGSLIAEYNEDVVMDELTIYLGSDATSTNRRANCTILDFSVNKQ